MGQILEVGGRCDAKRPSGEEWRGEERRGERESFVVRDWCREIRLLRNTERRGEAGEMSESHSCV